MIVAADSPPSVKIVSLIAGSSVEEGDILFVDVLIDDDGEIIEAEIQWPSFGEAIPLSGDADQSRTSNLEGLLTAELVVPTVSVPGSTVSS